MSGTNAALREFEGENLFSRGTEARIVWVRVIVPSVMGWLAGGTVDRVRPMEIWI